jgi:hypothetical protein
MIYRFYLKSKVDCFEYKTIKKLLNKNFEYNDYSKIYDEQDDFDLEIGEYKKLLNVIINNFLRMDGKLNIVGYEYIDMGLDILKKNIDKNNKIKDDYNLVNDSIKIIKKYYNKKCIRKNNIKNNNKLLTILIVLTIITLLILLLYLISKNLNLFTFISTIYIIILFIVVLILNNKNKK